MLNLNKINIAFFDLDGVLSVPRYRDSHGNITCGMSDDDWFDICQNRLDVYKDCVVPNQVLNLLETLKKNNATLYVLTHETNSGAYFNKVEYVLNNYKEYFNSYRKVLFVSKSSDKVKLIQSVLSSENIPYSRCLFVDDSYDLCLQVSLEGIQALHISELLLMNGDK